MCHRLGLVSQRVPGETNSLAEGRHRGIPRKTELLSEVVGPAGAPQRSRWESEVYVLRRFYILCNDFLPDTPILPSISEETRMGCRGRITNNTSVITWFHSFYLNQHHFRSGSL